MLQKTFQPLATESKMMSQIHNSFLHLHHILHDEILYLSPMSPAHAEADLHQCSYSHKFGLQKSKGPGKHHMA